MSEPPLNPPNPDEPQHGTPPPEHGDRPSPYPQQPSDPGAGQYPSDPQGPYNPPPSFAPPGAYGPPAGPGPNPYGEPGYGQPPGGYPVPPRPANLNIADRVGERARRRPEARTSITLAGLGAALLVFGVLIWAGGYFGDGINIDFSGDGRPTASGDDRRFLGAGLFFVVTVAGYALMVLRRRGPLATAGTVAGALGVPLTLIFLSLSFEDLVLRGQYPFNLDLVYILSILIWLASYLFVPGASGRNVFLALSALNLSSYVAVKAAGDDLLQTAARATTGTGLSDSGTGTVAAVGIVFGLVYYAIAAILDYKGKYGAGAALAVAAFFTTAGGISAGSSDFGLAGTGVALLLVGAVLIAYGGFFGRRFTTWAWGAGFVLGVILIVAKVSPDNYTAAGITFIVLGAVVVAIATFLPGLLRERPDIEEPRAPIPVG